MMGRPTVLLSLQKKKTHDKSEERKEEGTSTTHPLAMDIQGTA